MRILFHLSTCDTCKRIIKELRESSRFGETELQDIKTESITPEQMDEMHRLGASYEALFSRRAMKYKSMGLADKDLSEMDYRQLILDEYTFLKRPVLIFDEQIAIGNSKASTAQMLEILS